MKRKSLILVVVCCLFLAGLVKVNAAEENTTQATESSTLPTELKSMFDTYYNGGTYVKGSQIFINKSAVEDDFETHFHNPKGGDNVILDRVTRYCGNYLYFVDTNVGFATSDEGELVEFTYVEGQNYTSASTTNAIEEAFVTLYDFMNDSTLASGWELVGDKYVNTTAAVKKAAEAFTAPGWKSPDANYTDYSQVVVYESEQELVIELYVYSTNKGIVTTAADGEHCLFSKANVSLDGRISIVKALEIASYKAHNTYTSENYTLTGTVTNVYNTQYGNFYLEDEEGNQICVYGLYSADGSTRYDAMTYKPVEGDVITITGPLGMYNTTKQTKNANLLEIVEKHECDWSAATCTEPKTCSICNATNGEALGHSDNDTNHECDVCKVNVGSHEDRGDGTCDYCGETVEGNEPVFGMLAEFTFGANGSASHNDGTDITTATTYTNNGYTLKFSSVTKVYGGARDAKGNSCLKFGTSKLIGSLTFSVPDNVTEVVIYIAKYKANTSKIDVNGTNYTLTKNSNDGAYDVITIDTTTTKTVTIKTVATSYRCMMNTIVFNGYSQ